MENLGKSILLLLLLTIISCKPKKVSIEDISFENIQEIHIKSIKVLKRQVYYTYDLKFRKNKVTYDYDDRRDIVIGEIGVLTEFKDFTGEELVPDGSMEGLYSILSNDFPKSEPTLLIKTEILVKSKEGEALISTFELEPIKKLEIYIQEKVLNGNVKIRNRY